jgi:phage terminase large subunit-like protein
LPATELTRFSPPAKHRARWLAQRRPTQGPPPGDDWDVWLLLAGRGFGKTRTAAEWLWWQAWRHPGSRWALVAPTFADARDTCVEGESGLLACAPPEAVEKWNRSLGELVFTNGSRAKLFSGDEPNRLRGPQHHGAWVDELAAFDYGQEAWDQLMFGLRLGEHPRTVVTTTPRPTPLVRSLVAQDNVATTRGSTYENAANLAPSTLQSLLRRYEGTRLGRQELMGEILDDVEGALWTRQLIPEPTAPPPHDWRRLVVAVDPPGGGRAEAGIIAAGMHRDRYWVLRDRSARLSPREWGAAAVDLYHELRADRIVAERNYGGDMVAATIAGIDPTAALEVVTATRGKAQRAEPIAALYEQGHVCHAPGLDDLEDQMCTWVPGTGESPDRLDAAVWALTWLLERERMAYAETVVAAPAARPSYWRR